MKMIIIKSNNFNNFIKVSDGKVKIVNDNYKELLKPNKPKRDSKKNNFGKKVMLNLQVVQQTCQENYV